MTDKLSWMCAEPECERPRQGTLAFCATHLAEQRKKKRNDSKPTKEYKPIKKISPQQASIKSQLQRAYAEKARITDCQTACSGCEQAEWEDHDHSVSQKRCKEIGKPELITDLNNFEYSCRQCHMEWESYKSGEFRKHKNFERRMAYLKEQDHESFIKRMEVVELFNRPKQTI